MGKRFLLFIILIFNLFLISSVFAVSGVDSEMQKITHYAKDFEIGNINYVKLLVYISESRQNLNEILGATEKEMGGILKQEKIKEILGEPIEETKWVWVEGEEQDKKLDSPVPVWKKVIFDGKKIQITLDAFPSIFTKKKFVNEEMKEEFNEEGIKEGDLIYRLNFWIEFKKPEEQLNIKEKIDEIKSLAESFNLNPSQINAEILAKESVNAEKKFESYIRQNQGKCEDLMASVFGGENQMPAQSMIVQEINFYEGEKFEVIARLELCDECEWNWINLDLWTETRGPIPKMGGGEEMISPEQFKNKDDEYYKTEIINLLDSYKKSVDEENWKEANNIKQKLWMINEAWNQKANDVWKEINEEFKTKIESMTQQEQEEFNQNYGWIKQEQERKSKERILREQNYEERKQFYMNLFSGYDKKEYSFKQIEFKKRLIELFKEGGEEICDNNLDDNENEKIDCDDDLCTGKICGKGISSVVGGNGTKEIEVDFYCIAGECRAKEQIIEIKEIVCGNHLCEENETIENCAEDCALCQEYAPIECSGRVIFKGKDEKGCPLEPVCIEEQICNADEDCKFLCGVGECIEGKCKVKELSECSEEECADGAQKIMSCKSGESIVSSICVNKLWTDTGMRCSEGDEDIKEEIFEEEIVGNVCTTRADCGREEDVCSNGKCISIPKSVEIRKPDLEQSEEQSEENLQELEVKEDSGQKSETEQDQEFQEPLKEEITEYEESSELPEIAEQSEEQTESLTGNVIFSVKKIVGGITGFVIGITGFSVEENGNEIKEEIIEEDVIEKGEEIFEDREEKYAGGDMGEREEERKRDEEERRGDEEEDRRKEEQEERCKKDCNRPCIEKCIRENCGENMDCNVDEESKKCEGKCQPDDSCVEKCMKGEGEWWKEFENKEEFKEQKGGFEAGGNCRTAKGRTEGFIWFGGWGDPFEKIQPLKNKYYSGGNAEWCKFELESLIRQREEFEKGFNQEFVKWFFEDYLANSAENWEQAVSGVFELYWKNVDNQREIAFRMKCLDENDIEQVMDYNLLNMSYETAYGKIEYWEEIKPVEVPGMDGKTTIISPYMKIWVFPPKEFIKYEMKKAMKNHEFPGSPEDKMERKNEEGLTSKEKEMIKQDKKFMKMITSIAEEYGGSFDVAIQIKDSASDDIVFNLYAQINENDIIKMTPMLPEELPSKDVVVEIDFEKIYELIYSQEKDMGGEMIESPPWDRKKTPPIQKIKETVNGIKMYFKVRGIVNSAKITPAESEKDVKNLFKKFMPMMRGENEKEDITDEKIRSEDEEKDVWESKEVITGQAIG
jgi:hypothetical protein